MNGMSEDSETGLALILVPDVDLGALPDTGEALAAIAARAQDFADGARAANTRRA